MTAENRPRTRAQESQKFLGKLVKLATGNWRQREKKGSAHHKLQDERTWTHADVVLAEAPAAPAADAAVRVVSKPPVLRQAKQLPCIQKSFQWSFASGAVSVSGSGSGQGNGKGSQRQAHTHAHTHIYKMAAAAAQKVSWRMKNFLAMPRTSSSCAMPAKQWRQKQQQQQLLTLATAIPKMKVALSGSMFPAASISEQSTACSPGLRSLALRSGSHSACGLKQSASVGENWNDKVQSLSGLAVSLCSFCVFHFSAVALRFSSFSILFLA